MCELFGISSSRPASFGGEFAEFRLRGGLTADNPDGWGLAWWDGSGFQLVKEPRPAHLSTRMADLGAAVRADLFVAHVRKARLPPINTLGNTHPFLHDCCGKAWVFAHNGLVPEVVGLERGNDHPVCRPAGETDSEYAFCHLLGHIARQFDVLPGAGTADSFLVLAGVSELIASNGKFNFLLADGEYLIAYGHDRLHHREGGAQPFAHVMVATEPLAGADGWTAFAPGELRVYRRGRLVGSSPTRPHHGETMPG